MEPAERNKMLKMQELQEQVTYYDITTDEGRERLLSKPINCQIVGGDIFPYFTIQAGNDGYHCYLHLAEDDFVLFGSQIPNLCDLLQSMAFHQICTKSPLQLSFDLLDRLQALQESGETINPLLAEDGELIDIADLKTTLTRLMQPEGMKH